MSKCGVLWYLATTNSCWQIPIYSLVYKPNPNSQNLPANKDEDFILGQHVPDEVKQVGLFLLFMDNQHCLLYCVNCLRPRETQETFKHVVQMRREKGFLAQLHLLTRCMKKGKKKSKLQQQL